MANSASAVFTTAPTVEALAAYQQWEREHSEQMRFRYQLLPSQVVFAAREDDIPALDPSYRFQRNGDRIQVFAGDQLLVTLPPADPNAIISALQAIDGQRSFADIATLLGNNPAALSVSQPLYRHLLGYAVVIPQTIATLEQQLSRLQLVRFPHQPPYSLLRSYWENAIAVRRFIPQLLACNSGSALAHALAGLHRLATMGSSGQNYFGGAGGTVTSPGQMRDHLIQSSMLPDRLATLQQWANILVPGTQLQLSGLIHSPAGLALAELREQGLECLHLGDAQSNTLALACTELQQIVANAQVALQQQQHRELLGHCADFHHLLVNLHPFTNINNSLAMNIINYWLSQAGLGQLPHLYLDYLAQRSQAQLYRQLFAAAATQYSLHNDPNRDKAAAQAAHQLLLTANQNAATSTA